ncbi:ATP-binding protein [Sulfolobus tengchongensis]|uniref:ATP-binding protein n=1 Tax=Sulfolobus tengchongensis TaxID=207809 RepID=A0AAX4L0U8_9CREN
MSIDEIKQVIVDQSEILTRKMRGNIIKRDVPDLLKYLKIPNALAILGVRRSGKSTLSILLLKDKKFSYINFDDERLKGLKTEDLNKILQAIYELYGDIEYMIFDEIHNVEGWELFVSRLRDIKKIIVTGSNSKMLSGELATFITGRHSDYVLFPFSFKEYLRFKGWEVQETDLYSTFKISQLKNELENYLIEGGFPESILLGRDQINFIYNDILFKDVISRYKIRDIEKFRDFARTLISYYSNEVSLRALSKVIDVNKVTVESWANGLNDAYLIFFLPRYGEKLRQRLTYNKKVYTVDPGIISNIAIRGKDKGRIMENLVAIKLFRELQGTEHLFYIRNNYEVDFYDEINSRLIQVTYASDKVENREIKGLIEGYKLTKAKELIIVSWDIKDTLKVEGREIKIVPVYEFLLK